MFKVESLSIIRLNILTLFITTTLSLITSSQIQASALGTIFKGLLGASDNAAKGLNKSVDDAITGGKKSTDEVIIDNKNSFTYDGKIWLYSSTRAIARRPNEVENCEEGLVRELKKNYVDLYPDIRKTTSFSNPLKGGGFICIRAIENGWAKTDYGWIQESNFK